MRKLAPTSLLVVLLVASAAGQVTTRQMRWRPLGPMYGEGPVVHEIAETAADPARLYASTYSGLIVSEDGGSSWEMRGCPPSITRTGGFVSASSTDADVILYATSLGDLFRSADAGRTWQLVIPAPGPWGINIPTFAPSDPTWAYAAESDGLWRSTDGGLTFEQILDDVVNSGGWGYRAVVDLADPLHAYFLATGQGIHETWDGGLSWVLKPFPPGMEGYEVAIDPNDSSRLLLGDQGVYLSRDGGTTWEGPDGPGGALGTVRAVGFDPFVAGRLYATFRNGSLTYSDDDGATWFFNYDPPLFDEPAFYNGLLASTVSPGRFLLGGHFGILRSLDGAHTFVRSNDGLEHNATVLDVILDPFDPGRLVARTARSVYSSEDGGLTWTEASGISRFAAFPGALVADPTTPGRFYGGSLSAAFLRSDDGGRSFTWQAGLKAWIRQVVAHPTVPGRVFVACKAQGSGLLRSDDAGVTFAPTSVPDVLTLSLAISAVEPEVMYCASTSTVYFSDDGGATWSAADAAPSGYVYRLVPDPTRADVAWAAAFYGGLFRTEDGGRTWTGMSDAFHEYVDLVAVSPEVPDLVIANDYVFPRAWVSRDAEHRATPLGFGLPSPLRALTFAPEGIYAGTMSGGVWILH